MQEATRHIALQLKIDEVQLKALSTLKADINWRIEHGTPLSQALFDELVQQMRLIIEQQDLPSRDLAGSLHLTHARNDLLNLPWQLAFEADRGIDLLISKGLTTSLQLQAHQPTNPLPLKVLIMIASPEGQQIKGRLNYEEEEVNIIQAFQQLKVGRSVEIDFTDNGSLSALERKLQQKHYHIIHIIAHGTYDEPLQTGYLMLEDDMTLEGIKVEGKKLAQLLGKHGHHRPSLVLLASCQTAAGTSSDEFRGITNQILQAKIPAVIAMSISILDTYASAFSAHLYEQLALQQTLPQAFQAAVLHLKEKEQAENQNHPPVQWIIPQLYFNERCEHIIPWELHKESTFAEPTTSQDTESASTFIGRRKEVSQLLPVLLKNEPILIYGLGGLGKTALARQLTYKFRLRQTGTPVISIECKERGLESILQELSLLLTKHGAHTTITPKPSKDKELLISRGVEFLQQLKQFVTPIFLLDGLEEGQASPGGPFTAEYEEMLALLNKIGEEQLAPVIITSRYYDSALDLYHTYPLRGLNYQDFWKKCSTLSLGNLHRPPIQVRQVGKKSEELNFNTVAELLYQGLEGNVWLLEQLDLIYRSEQNKYYDTKEKLMAYLLELDDKITILCENYLSFTKVWSTLSEEERNTLRAMLDYSQAISKHAIRVQVGRKKLSKSLKSLVHMCLAERHYIQTDKRKRRPFYIIPGIIKGIVRDKMGSHPDFSHRKAGFHYLYFAYRQRHWEIRSLALAFWHYHKAKHKTYVKLLSQALLFQLGFSKLYDDILEIGGMTEDLLKEETPVKVLDYLGQSWLAKGENDKALAYFTKALRKPNYFHSLFTTRVNNNIGLLHYQVGNYSAAEEAFFQVYKKRWQNIDLYMLIHNNLGLVKVALGKYEEALSLFKKSLKVNRFTSKYLHHPDNSDLINSNIGEVLVAMHKNDEATELLEKAMLENKRNNSASTNNPLINNFAKSLIPESPHKALYYQEQALKQAQEEGNQYGEAVALNNLGYIYTEKEKLARAKALLKRALQLSQQLKNKSIEGACQQNFGFYYYRKNEIDIALKHYKLSLELLQEVHLPNHPKILEAYHIIGEVYLQEKNYETAVTYLEQAAQQIMQISRPDELELSSVLAFCYLNRRQYQLAAALYEKVVAAYHQFDKVSFSDLYIDHIYLSDAYISLQQEEKALASLLAAQKKFSEELQTEITNLGPLLDRLGSTYRELGEFEKAISSYQAILEGGASADWLDRNKTWILYNLGFTSEDAKDYEVAIRQFQDALQHSSTDKTPCLYTQKNIHWALGRLQKRKEEFEQAEVHYRAALQLAETLAQQKDQAILHDSLGRLKLGVADWPNARLAFEKAISINANEYPIWMIIHWRGLALVEQKAGNFMPFAGNIQEAIKVSVEYQVDRNLEELCRYFIEQIKLAAPEQDQMEEWLKQTQQLLLPAYTRYAELFQTTLTDSTNQSEDGRQD